jgi:DNA-binding response OmpR family regulator
LVEDDPATLKALKGIFHRRGWDVMNVTTVAEALSRLDWEPDCVVLDLMLPDGDGSAVLARIRSQGLAIRVAVTTGSSDIVRLQAALDLKPDIFLTKPVNLAALLEGLS